MSGGLFALFDDVAALVKLTAASVDDVGAAAGRASVKAAGVVVDDTAVTPQYLHHISADRELPIVRKIARGSLRNKLLFILPGLLLLSQFLPGLLTPLLMVGGAYLCYEGAEKVWERIAHHDDHDASEELVAELASSGPEGSDEEKVLIAGAIRTDLVLSAEIMVIALNEVATQSLLTRTLALITVSVALTILVYGVVAVIVKLDDMGLSLTQRKRRPVQQLGRILVASMPIVLATLSIVGTAAMLWVGGHILIDGAHEVGWHAPHDLVHYLQEHLHRDGRLGAVLNWLVGTSASALLGVACGFVLVGIGAAIKAARR